MLLPPEVAKLCRLSADELSCVSWEDALAAVNALEPMLQAINDGDALREEYMRWRRRRGLEPTAEQWMRFYDWEMALIENPDMPGIGIYASEGE